MAGLEGARLNAKHPLRVVLVVLALIAIPDLQSASPPAVHDHLLPLVQLLCCLLAKVRVAFCSADGDVRGDFS